MNKTKQMTVMAAFIAIGVLGASFLWFPTGIARAFPVQHALNVISAVVLGPIPTVIIAFGVGLVRNLLGLGTLLAFPGGLAGAIAAGLFFRMRKTTTAAIVGEIIGTGIIGSLLAIPVARILMDQAVGVFAFVPGFIISSLVGSVIAALVLPKIKPLLEKETI
ncbi:energy coupling factor transporter S component ThiW [Amphibacillus marinus]|uniref:Energy coupling factor transporter S component ThiW n=1 Tax=Amphibacillus marinus TaxID=872970 RepID=A0A1H8MKQ4_9BACI|nr:energy coupling factor transporter S component ThiW [Amphibacillus marinus]SEO17716.1 energy coupling factor transporter S component ThiW [Amphibacillus marinus]